MKFNALYNSFVNEAKIDDLLNKSDLGHGEIIWVTNVNNFLNNKTKFVPWLIKYIADEHNHYVNVNRIVNALNYFDKNQSRFDEKDINKYTFKELVEKIEELKIKQTRSEASKETSKDAKKVFENDKCIVLNIKSEEASNKYGKGTKWCISAKQNNQWDNYHNRKFAEFYFLISKESSEKFAFAVYPNRIDCYDFTDEEVVYATVVKEFEIDKSILKSMELSEEQLVRICVAPNSAKITKNEDGSFDVEGDVQISEMVVKDYKLLIKFGKINGSFDAIRLDIRNLEGFPEEVEESLTITGNYNLKSLKGLPTKKVGTNFVCSSCALTSLEGMPKEVDSLYCQSNNITNLEGCTNVKSKICVENCHLISLKGCPQNNISIYCNENQVSSLEGCPPRVTELLINDNYLTSLKGGPKEVEYKFGCAGNNITSLEGCPEDVGENFDLYGNQLSIESFENVKCNVAGDLYIGSNHEDLVQTNFSKKVLNEIAPDFMVDGYVFMNINN